VLGGIGHFPNLIARSGLLFHRRPLASHVKSHTVANMLTRRKATKEASEALGKLFERIITELPPLAIIFVLRPLPGVELARLACVHKAFWDALISLRQECMESGYNTGPYRYNKPKWIFLESVPILSRLERASFLGDITIIRSIISSGVDESGTPLAQAMNWTGARILDEALFLATRRRHVEVAGLLLGIGADVHAPDFRDSYMFTPAMAAFFL
jgi:hypothetical protein